MAIVVQTGYEAGAISIAPEPTTIAGTSSFNTSVLNDGGSTASFRVNPTGTGTGTSSHSWASASGAWIQFYFRVVTLPAANSEQIANHSACALRIDSAGKLSIWDATTKRSSDSTTTLSINTWYRIAFKHNGTGANETAVKIDDGAEECVCTSSNGTSNLAALGKGTNRNGNTVDFYYDDVTIDDADYPEDIRYFRHLANAVGTDNDWTKVGTTDAWTNWNDQPLGTTNHNHSGSTTASNAQTVKFPSTASIVNGGTLSLIRVLANGKTSATSQSGGSGAIRRRINGGAASDVAKTLTTTDAYYTTDYADSLTDLDNNYEVGWLKNATGAARQQTIEDVWLIVGYVLSSSVTATQTITGLARITGTTNQITTGKSRIQATANQTTTGKSRVQAIVNATLTGLARIQKVVNATINGLANILAFTDQTITGKSRIQTPVDQTITGKSAIIQVVNQTQPGTARIQITAERTITGLSRIQKVVEQMTSGKARIQTLVDQMQTGVSRIRTVVNAVTTGVARITVSTLQTILGTARVQKAVNATITGLARVQATTNQTITGIANIVAAGFGVTDQTITGQSRITATASQTTTGRSRITATTLATITGKSRVQTLATVTINGLARIGNVIESTINGLSRISAPTQQTLLGKANIRATTTQTIQGVARIAVPEFINFPLAFSVIGGQSGIEVTEHTTGYSVVGGQSGITVTEHETGFQNVTERTGFEVENV